MLDAPAHARIGVREVTSDVARRSRAEHRVGQRMTDGVGVGVTEQATVERNRDAAENQRTPVDELDASRSRHRFAPIRGLLDRGPRAASDGLGERKILRAS